ncbi:MAG: hypothetical protein BMS9Abin39_0337 [Ignavibacteria bacterium]|nr:MAG: hypothetical protein BMS9Abin39_0337 [Ignavibacteria bacterium]
MEKSLTRYDERIILSLLIGLTISFLVSLFLLQIFAALLILAWLFEKNENKRKAFDEFNFIFLSFVILRILTIFLSEHFDVSSETFYKNGLFFLSLFPLSFYFKVLKDEKVFLITKVYIYNTLIITLVSIIAFNLGFRERATSVFLGNTTYTPQILFGLSMLIGYSFSRVKKFDWIYWCAGIAILLTGLVVSLGRTDIVIGILIIFVGIIFKKFSIKSLALFTTIVTIFMVVSFQSNKIVVEERIKTPVTFSERDIIWKGAYDLALEHPLWGFGPRTFRTVFPYFDQLTDKGVGGWHNDYITIYMESGLITLFIMLLLIWRIIFSGIKKHRNYDRTKPKHLNLLWGTLVGLLALLLTGMTAGFINAPIISLLFIYVLAIFSSLIYPIQTANSDIKNSTGYV